MGIASNQTLSALGHRAELLVQGGSSRLGSVCFAAYRWRVFRPAVRLLLKRLEAGLMFSTTWRRIFTRYYGVALGLYSYGPGLRPGLFPPGTEIGAFCSIAAGVEVLRRNHPTDWPSQHPLFFNRVGGLLDEDIVPSMSDNPLRIGNDVWIGLNAIICPGCRIIGDGAIVAAGSVVTKDVPPFTIVGGCPAKPIRRRFPPEVENVVAASAWWALPLSKIVEHLDLFMGELTADSLARFTEAFPAVSAPSGIRARSCTSRSPVAAGRERQ